MNFIKNYSNWKYIVEQAASLTKDAKQPISEVGFPDQESGDKFRDWMNVKHSDFSTSTATLGPSDGDGAPYSYNNDVIKAAYAKYGDEYEKITGTSKSTSSKIGVDEYKKPAETEIKDEYTLNESCLKEYAIGTGQSAANLLNIGNSYISGLKDLITNNEVIKNAFSNEKYQELATEVTSGKIKLPAASKKGQKNKYLEWNPIDSSGATWKLVSRSQEPIGKLAMGFSDTFWAQCDWTDKEMQARGTSSGKTRVLLGLIKDVKKSQKFKKGDTVYVQTNASYPYNNKMKGMYLIAERKISKKDKEYYSKNFSGSGDVRKKDFIMLDTPYTGNSDSKISWGVATIIKAGKNNGGGFTNVERYKAKYF